MSDKTVEVPEQLIEDIDYHLNRYNTARDKANAGHHLIELFNRVADMGSYHSGYDVNTGTLPYQREDEWDEN